MRRFAFVLASFVSVVVAGLLVLDLDVPPALHLLRSVARLIGVLS